MAQQLVVDTTEEGEVGGDLRIIRDILSKHDKSGRIMEQVNEHLEKDQISLKLLTEFGDTSLIQIIDSWNINTFDQKPFLIRASFIGND